MVHSANPFKVNLSIPSPLSTSADQKPNSWFAGSNGGDTNSSRSEFPLEHSESTQLVLNQLQTRYRECAEQKRQLKRSLKK